MSIGCAGEEDFFLVRGDEEETKHSGRTIGEARSIPPLHGLSGSQGILTTTAAAAAPLPASCKQLLNI